jgi:hypothetical protein
MPNQNTLAPNSSTRWAFIAATLLSLLATIAFVFYALPALGAGLGIRALVGIIGAGISSFCFAQIFSNTPVMPMVVPSHHPSNTNAPSTTAQDSNRTPRFLNHPKAPGSNSVNNNFATTKTFPLSAKIGNNKYDFTVAENNGLYCKINGTDYRLMLSFTVDGNDNRVLNEGFILYNEKNHSENYNFKGALDYKGQSIDTQALKHEIQEYLKNNDYPLVPAVVKVRSNEPQMIQLQISNQRHDICIGTNDALRCIVGNTAYDVVMSATFSNGSFTPKVTLINASGIEKTDVAFTCGELKNGAVTNIIQGIYTYGETLSRPIHQM